MRRIKWGPISRDAVRRNPFYQLRDSDREVSRSEDQGADKANDLGCFRRSNHLQNLRTRTVRPHDGTGTAYATSVRFRCGASVDRGHGRRPFHADAAAALFSRSGTGVSASLATASLSSLEDCASGIGPKCL